MKSNYISNKGKRISNQDAILIKSPRKGQDVFLLADGMGGYKNGKYAANFIITQLYELIKSKEHFNDIDIQNSINEVTRRLAKEIESLGLKMGATLGGVICEKEVIHCFWVGDVKIIYVKEGKIAYESVEHNLKNELIKNEVFVEVNNAKKYNHIVTRSIQSDLNKSIIDYHRIDDFEKGNFIVIASDGVTDSLDNFQLLSILNSKKEYSEKLSELNDRLINSAEDNYSLLLIY